MFALVKFLAIERLKLLVSGNTSWGAGVQLAGALSCIALSLPMKTPISVKSAIKVFSLLLILCSGKIFATT